MNVFHQKCVGFSFGSDIVSMYRWASRQAISGFTYIDDLTASAMDFVYTVGVFYGYILFQKKCVFCSSVGGSPAMSRE